MKRITISLLLIILLISCTKSTKETFTKSTGFVKDIEVWAISDENQFGKRIVDINDKVNLFFGDQVIIINEKNINDINYYRIKLKKDIKEYWIKKDYIAEKFIIITKPEVKAFSLTDEINSVKANLHTGDFGIFLKKEGQWINTDFMANGLKNNVNKVEYIGNMWIKEKSGYTDNIDMAKEAFYLYYARYYKTAGDKFMTDYFLNKALAVSISKKRKTIITPVILDFQKSLNN